MTRVLTYNILLGGTNRTEQLEKMIRASQADIIGLVEATDPEVIESLAERLEMHHTMSGRGTHKRDWQMGILSRLPIEDTVVHARPHIFTRKNLLEVQLKELDGSQLSVFIIHQPAGYREKQASREIRRNEIEEILKIMTERAGRIGKPHLLMGDFNSIAPGDPLQGSILLRNILKENEQNRQKKRAETTQQRTYTRAQRIRYSMYRGIGKGFELALKTKTGSKLIDSLSQIYGKGGIDLLLQAGYIDSFRYIHKKEKGFTFSAATPACRIDYIFCSPELASRLAESDVVKTGEEVRGDEASDHLPVYVDLT